MNRIFAKTAKGQEEIEKRTNDIPLRVRRILILIDGKRSVDELRVMAVADDLEQTLDILAKDGFIESGEQKEAQETANNEESPAGHVFRELPPTPDHEDMEKARHFIINTLKTFCGPMSHLSIVKAAAAATTHQELRESFLPWREAILGTSSGRSRIEELTQLLLKVI